MKSAIFIDGAHLNSIMKTHHGGVLLSYEKLAGHVAHGDDILRTYYYDSPPWQDNPPTPDQSARFAKRQKFFQSLRQLTKFEVREGRCARIWDKNASRWKYEQKRVDVLCSVDLVRLASKGKIERAVLVTGDSDFLPAVAVAKDEGVQIRLIHSPNRREVHRDLWDAADERVVLDAAIVTATKL